jgi:osmoprotectant transport system permease protein
MIISRGFGLGIASAGGQIVGGGLIVIALCLILEGLLAVGERLVTPRGLRQDGHRGGSAADQPLAATS